MEQLIIIGASGHGRVVADIARLNGYRKIVFLDDNKSLKYCGGYEVVGAESTGKNMKGYVFVAIGNNAIRQKICEKYRERLISLIHPDAVIADDTVVGIGSVIMAGAVINSGSRIGIGCIINTSSSVDHDCIIGDYVHIAVGAHLSGTVTVGNTSWIGAGSTINNNVSICSQCMIGAGAVVIKDIEEQGTYVGVPTRKIVRR